MIRPSDPGEDIYDTSVQLHAVVDEGMKIVDWVQHDPLVGLPSIFGPMLLLSWAFRRSRSENKHDDWTTR